MLHATTAPVARGAIAPTKPDATGAKVEPKFALLFLDEDGVYRWYEDDGPTSAAADRFRAAIDAGVRQWPKLEIVEIRGAAVVWSEPEQFEDTHASEELQEMTKSE